MTFNFNSLFRQDKDHNSVWNPNEFKLESDNITAAITKAFSNLLPVIGSSVVTATKIFIYLFKFRKYGN